MEKKFRSVEGEGANTDMGRKPKKTKSAKTEIKRFIATTASHGHVGWGRVEISWIVLIVLIRGLQLIAAIALFDDGPGG